MGVALGQGKANGQPEGGDLGVARLRDGQSFSSDWVEIRPMNKFVGVAYGPAQPRDR